MSLTAGVPEGLVGDEQDGRREAAPMRAGELASLFPTVGLDTLAIEAARLLAAQKLPGLIVVDAAGRPSTILHGSQVLHMAVPGYCQENPTLAR